MIYGERIRLRAGEKEDLPRFVAWLNDPEVRQGLSLYLPLSMAEEQSWFDSMIKQPAAQHPMVIEILQEGSWLAVGNCGFHEIDWKNRSAEVGIFIGEKQYWNQGFGTEVMGLLLRHGFLTLNLHRVFLRVYANNARAVHAYEKAGFVKEGRMRQAQFADGVYVDVIFMSVLRSEWETTHP